MKEKFKLTNLERSWILYDIGNSAFILMVSTLIPIFFNSLAESAGVNEDMYLSYWGYAGSISTVLVAIIAPVCGTLSDRKFKKPIFLLTVLPILASVLLRKIFVRSFFSDLISCGLLLLLTHTGDFLLRLINGTVAGKLYFTRLLPTVLVTLLFQPLIYWLVKIVEKIGDPYEAT